MAHQQENPRNFITIIILITIKKDPIVPDGLALMLEKSVKFRVEKLELCVKLVRAGILGIINES